MTSATDDPKTPLAPPWLLTCWAAVAVWLLLSSAIAGLILATDFNPQPEAAADSIWNWQDRPNWMLLRSVHFWAAHLGIVAAVLDLVGRFLAGRHRPPFAGQWVLSVLLLLLIAATTFTGEMLSGDDRAASRVAWWNEHFTPLDDERGPATIYAVHTIVLPVLIAGALLFRPRLGSEDAA